MSSDTPADSNERLNKMLASRLGIGRRQADDLIEHGRVTVNGQPARLGQQISPSDVVELDHTKVAAGKAALVYVLLNKPTGYVSSRAQQGGTPTVYSLLPDKYSHLKTVGRLDKDTSGLILMTNDGDLALQMTHPRFGKEKTYLLTLDIPLAPAHEKEIMTRGVELVDGQSVLSLKELNSDRRQWQVMMSEGRNRQIRRTFAALGYTVTRLHRTKFGPWSIDQMDGKRYIELEPDEIR